MRGSRFFRPWKRASSNMRHAGACATAANRRGSKTMGPTNVALVKLFRADQALREAQERLDAATKNVRIQERKVNDLNEKLKQSQTRHKELQAKGGALDLDMRTRDAHIEKLRTQQQVAKNN